MPHAARWDRDRFLWHSFLLQLNWCNSTEGVADGAKCLLLTEDV